MKKNIFKKAMLMVLIFAAPFMVKGTQVYKSIDQNWIRQNNTDVLINLDQHKISIISDETIDYFVYNPMITNYGNIKAYGMKGFVGNDDTCGIVVCDYGNGQTLLTINTAFGRIKYLIKE